MIKNMKLLYGGAVNSTDIISWLRSLPLLEYSITRSIAAPL